MTSKVRSPQTKAPRNDAPEHSDLDALLASIAGELSGAAARALASHTSQCPDCREQLRALTMVVQAGAAGALEAVPGALRRNADRLFSSWRREKRGESSRNAEVVRDRAIPAPEPRMRPAWGLLRMRVAPSFATDAPVSYPVGFRSASTQPRCELEGGGYRIELEWMPTGRLCAVRGQIMRERDDAELHPQLSLEFDGGPSYRVTPSARGFFGPIAAPRSRVRILLDTVPRAYRSRWLELT